MPATTVEGHVEDALFAHLAAFTPALPTAYPNRDFKTPATGNYLRAMHQPNDAEQVTLGDSGTRRLMGLLQIDVMAREDTGSLPSRDVAGALITYFDAALRVGLTAGAAFIRLEKPSRASAPIQANGWSQTPVTVRYYADAPIN